MKSWRCDFCELQLGPNKTPHKLCDSCRLGSRFVEKAQMHPKEKIEWKRHQDLDKFIDSLDFNFSHWQRELIHCYCASPKPKRIAYPKHHGRTFYKTNAMAAMEILMQGMKQKEAKND